MSTGKVIVDRRDATVEVRLSNPDKFNAMSLEMWLTLATHIRALHEDSTVRALVIRGDGDKAFVSGADISEFDRVRSAESGSGAYDRAVQDAQQALIGCSFPVIASIHGICMGGGLGLALACDLRYASTTARFRMPAARLGLGYSLSGVRRMVDIVGAARAADLFMTARTFDAHEAERIGLVHSIYPAPTLDAVVAETVCNVAANAPLTLSLVKAAIHLSLAGNADHSNQSEQASIEIERRRQVCVNSSDYAEGRRAFAQKREPRFTGK
jgi:enoyl-CoA hydratase/carnithine racemase